MGMQSPNSIPVYPGLSRRQMLSRLAAGFGMVGLGGMLGEGVAHAATEAASKVMGGRLMQPHFAQIGRAHV